VAAKALVLSGDPKNKEGVAAAMKKVRVETPVGVLDWTKSRPGIPYNVVPTPIPGGQWVKTNDKYKIDFVICEHSDDPKIPIGGRLKAY
jgi:branched-chain amino acid transport system substrate-binding protein